MIIKDKIYLRKKRDFSDLFNTTFAFLRKNLGVLLGSFLLGAGPFVILTAVVIAFFQASVFKQFLDLKDLLFRSDSTQILSDMVSTAWPWLIVIYLCSLLSISFCRTSVASAIVIYESKNEGDDFTVAEVLRKTYREVFIVFGGQFLLSVISMIVLGLVATPFILMGVAGGVGGAVFAGFLFIMLFIAFGPQLVYVFQFAPPFVMVRDKVFIFSAVGRTFKNIKGNFWWTWVIMVCLYFMVGLISMFGSLPATIYQQLGQFQRTSPEEILNVFSSPVYIGLFIFSLIWSNISQILADVMVAISYYSYEEEKTGQGMMSMIDQIGKEEQNPNYN